MLQIKVNGEATLLFSFLPLLSMIFGTGSSCREANRRLQKLLPFVMTTLLNAVSHLGAHFHKIELN